MKIKELVELIGVLEPIRVLNGEFDVVEEAMAKDISPEILNKNIKSLYADKSVMSIIIK
jgi:hypothetical protein